MIGIAVVWQDTNAALRWSDDTKVLVAIRTLETKRTVISSIINVL